MYNVQRAYGVWYNVFKIRTDSNVCTKATRTLCELIIDN